MTPVYALALMHWERRDSTHMKSGLKFPDKLDHR